MFIGVGMDEPALRPELEDCLLTEAEMRGGLKGWGRLPDPFLASGKLHERCEPPRRYVAALARR